MDATGPETTGLARQLDALKRRGCTVLVAGDARGGPAMCRGLLGRPTLGRRHVLVPTTASVADMLSRRGDDGRDPERLGVVDASGAARTGVAAASAGPAAAIDPAERWYSRVDALDDVPALVREIAAHVRRLSPTEPEAGELRLCLDSLDPFIDAVDTATLFRFVHVLSGVVRGARGLGHVHVAAGSLPEIAAIRPVFDATVELRTDADGTTRQRWTVHETEHTTDWLPVDDGSHGFE